MSHVGAVRVSVLVNQPLPFAGVRVTRADVLGLKMLQLAVDVVAVCHLQLQNLFFRDREEREIKCNSNSRPGNKWIIAGYVMQASVAKTKLFNNS